MRLHSALAKNGLSGCGHPVDQLVARVLLRRDLSTGPSSSLGSIGLPVRGLISPVVRRRVGEIGRRLAEALAAQPGEEAGQAVVIVLAPALVRMMVALGALQAQAEEDLGGVGDRLVELIVAHLPVPVDGGGVLPFAGRRDDAADELVVGPIAGDHVADPFVEGVGRLLRPGQAGVAQDAAPAHREVGGVVRVCRAAGRSAWPACRHASSARKARTSSGVGSLPHRSRVTRRMNSPSVHRSRGHEAELFPAWPGPACRCNCSAGKSGYFAMGLPSGTSGAEDGDLPL